jgi:ribosome-associated protein
VKRSWLLGSTKLWICVNLTWQKSCTFTSYFLICSGTSTRHTQAICDGIVENLKKKSACSPSYVEGYAKGEWILLDYLNFVVHIFVERTREFYDLERLWKNAPKRSIQEGEEV